MPKKLPLLLPIAAYATMCMVDRRTNTPLPEPNTAEASAWLMKTLMLLASFFSA
jgi:hypothetical protein